MKIAFDVMGGDNAPQEAVLAVNSFVVENPDVEIKLFGNKYEIEKYLLAKKNVSVVHTLDVIDMGQKDLLAFTRHDTTSSMAMGLKALRDGECDAFLTAGATGAFVAESQLIVKRIPKFRKVALCANTRTTSGHNFIFLDVGANIDVNATHLVQYALAGKIYAKALFDIVDPKVALINNGIEKGKGRILEREVYEELQNNDSINFIGNLEPNDLFNNDNVDVLVGEGFTNNAIIKTAEGVLKGFGHGLKNILMKNFRTKLAALLLKKELKTLLRQYDHDDDAAAILLGIDKPVFKCHGNSKAKEFSIGLSQAKLIVEKEVVENIKKVVNNG